MSNIVSRQIHGLFKYVTNEDVLEGEEGEVIIKEELTSEKPSMIARFGSTEIKAILYPKMNKTLQVLFKRRFLSNMDTLSGFFPSNHDNIKRFSDLMIEDMAQLDILGSWRMEEVFLKNHFPHAKRIELKLLEPYYQKDPWTDVLSNKKVLVIHPFSSTIEKQYFTNRDKLFVDKRVLPQFKSFQTIKAVQTIAGNRCGFNSWFEALDYMKNEIDKKDFDVAIIGCGAYGFPLAAHVKRIGKKAVHLGGPTQMLFGVKGKRWVEREEFKDVINEYFVYPTDEDKPKNSSLVEGGCYW